MFRKSAALRNRGAVPQAHPPTASRLGALAGLTQSASRTIEETPDHLQDGQPVEGWCPPYLTTVDVLEAPIERRRRPPLPVASV